MTNISKMKNHRKKILVVVLQISILIMSIMAFSKSLSAEPTSVPFSTEAGKKAIIYNPNQTASGSSAKITGNDLGINFLIGIAKQIGIFIKPLLPEGATLSGFVYNILINAAWVGVVWVVSAMITTLITGGNPNAVINVANEAAIAASLGIGIGSIISGLGQGLGWAAAPGVGWVIGLFTFLAAFVNLTLRIDQRVVTFNSPVWQSQTGGNDCAQCNGKEFPCTMYQCKSLGQACDLKNEGDDAVCIYNNPGASAPSITPRNDSLSSSKLSYVSVPGGVQIRYSDDPNGCLPNSPPSFTFGIELDKPGLCKISNQLTSKFEDMTLPFGKGIFAYNQT
ncbi:MAG TPA: hypothetical protein VMC07_00030, partial [Candidatus Omnitrophota bacterium]|nr:hypothetical protein [Candidatus Omnitrophota bacterium]